MVLVVEVNGSGKTTTIGKLGAIAVREGFKVMLAAGARSAPRRSTAADLGERMARR
jgi:signal recognition particle GTPase